MSMETKTEYDGGAGVGTSFVTAFDDGDNELRVRNHVALGRIQTMGGQVYQLCQLEGLRQRSQEVN